MILDKRADYCYEDQRGVIPEVNTRFIYIKLNLNLLKQYILSVHELDIDINRSIYKVFIGLGF